MMMQTYKVKMGDVVVFPNGIEVNYDESTGSLVVLHPNRSKNMTIRQGENSAHYRVIRANTIVMIGVRS
jgi:hypothetical protein